MTEPASDEIEKAPITGDLRLPEPDLTEMWDALGDTVCLRLALNTLESNLPARWITYDACDALNALRIKLEEEELSQIRSWGPREYLLIKPLRPDAGVVLAKEAAEHVKALDDLGLIARIT